MLGNGTQENGCAIYGKNFIDVGAVEGVEGVHGQLHFIFFTEMQHAREAQVYGAQTIAKVSVASGFSYAVVYRISVIIGIEARKQCERPR